MPMCMDADPLSNPHDYPLSPLQPLNPTDEQLSEFTGRTNSNVNRGEPLTALNSISTLGTALTQAHDLQLATPTPFLPNDSMGPAALWAIVSATVLSTSGAAAGTTSTNNNNYTSEFPGATMMDGSQSPDYILSAASLFPLPEGECIDITSSSGELPPSSAQQVVNVQQRIREGASVARFKRGPLSSTSLMPDDDQLTSPLGFEGGAVSGRVTSQIGTMDSPSYMVSAPSLATNSSDIVQGSRSEVWKSSRSEGDLSDPKEKFESQSELVPAEAAERQHKWMDDSSSANTQPTN